jgi:hypothetical protein
MLRTDEEVDIASDNTPFAPCSIGYHAPFERFERLAVCVDGPAFLQRCKTCGSLWRETLHDARLISKDEASNLYPDWRG